MKATTLRDFLLSRRGEISADTIVRHTGLPAKYVKRFMRGLVAEGNAKTVGQLKTNGSPIWIVSRRKIRIGEKPAANRSAKRDRLWRAIRIKRRFSCIEMAAFTGFRSSYVSVYVRALECAGIVRRLPAAGHIVHYLLATDPGPQRPVLNINRQKR